MNYSFSQLVNLDELQSLCEQFTGLTGFVTAILDMEGNVLVATGWREICTCFHRSAPETALKCRESDTVLADRIDKGQKYCVYRCANGLIDVAVPIVVDNEQVGRLYSGQFLFAPPDMEFFRRQAAESGFDESTYLDAVSKVPVVSEERVRQVMGFLSRLAEMIGEMGLANKRVEALSLIVKAGPAVLFSRIASAGWPIEYVTENVVQFGYEQEELISGRVHYSSMIYPEDLQRIADEIEDSAIRGVDSLRPEYRIVCKGGEVRWVVERTVAERCASGEVSHYRGVVLDITERKLAEERIRASLAEKTVLLKEVHHRVKNNLQIICSLLDLQSDSVPDERSRIYFRDSQDRIRTMAFVHELLYQSSDLASIDFGEYIQRLVAYLFNSYVKDVKRISLNIMTDSLSLGIDRAIPSGLILNELVSNSLKHAFPGDCDGSITIELGIDRDGVVTIVVADDGVGFPGEVDFANTPTLGLQLVNMLVKQLRGRIELARDGGARFTIRFSGGATGRAFRDN